MFHLHHAHWPAGLPKSLSVPRTSIYFNLEVSARRYPDHCALDYYGSRMTYGELKRQVDALAGFLQGHCGVASGDRVLLYTQNSPQYVIGYYAILRADAVVVPVNPMNRGEELRHCLEDAGAATLLATQELWEPIEPLLGTSGPAHVVLSAYSDYLTAPTDLPLPAFVRAPREPIAGPGVTPWAEAIAAEMTPNEQRAGPEDLAVMPYTSGTTGKPKGCMHTHRSVLATSTAMAHWCADTSETVALAVLPMFHVTGMQVMNATIQIGGTVVLLTRWDRECATCQIERAGVTSFPAITTMLVDFLSNPGLDRHDLSSIMRLGGGGAAMPEAVARKLETAFGKPYIEGYGLSETMAPTHLNPPHRPKRQCAGIPIFDVDARVLDPDSLVECGPNQVGEIVVHGPQVFQGYWRQPVATAEAFLDHDGKRFFRTGDLGYHDEEGYFFITDRLKRMINASGFKVWPAEVEAMLYAHPDIQEVCVIGVRDPYRGETVKAVVVPKPAARGSLRAQAIIDWARERMATYKVPRAVELVAELPKTATGKIFWRKVQEEEDRRAAGEEAESAS